MSYRERILQIYVGQHFDRDAARTLAQAVGFVGGQGVDPGQGNVSALAQAVLGLPVEAGAELKALIEKWRGGKL